MTAICTPECWAEQHCTRWYHDPDGWDEHVASCEQCGGSDE